jgi:multidrug efflux pump subunit AcrB
VVSGNQSLTLESGNWLTSADAVRNAVVSTVDGAPVHVGDVATVSDGGGEPDNYVMHYPARGQAFPAVTLSIAKRKGTNAIDLTRAVTKKVEAVKGYLLPGDVNVSVTRNYGETAAHKANELLWHMCLAVISVSALIWLALGRRESAVVLTAIPVTLALTLFVFYLYGYTLNRITLFALIFSIGILVDDAIVVVENIVRHARMSRGGAALEAIAIRAVDEVGNPTILATLTVVAAILPMAFVGGLMGPYMRPIPVGASAAMVFSLLVAFLVTPWAAVRLLHPSHAHVDDPEDRLTALYRRVMRPLIANRKARLGFLGAVAVEQPQVEHRVEIPEFRRARPELDDPCPLRGAGFLAAGELRPKGQHGTGIAGIGLFLQGRGCGHRYFLWLFFFKSARIQRTAPPRFSAINSGASFQFCRC